VVLSSNVFLRAYAGWVLKRGSPPAGLLGVLNFGSLDMLSVAEFLQQYIGLAATKYFIKKTVSKINLHC